MRDRVSLLLVLSVILTAGLGCGLVERMSGGSGEGSGSNKTVADKAVDTTVGDTRIGIKACDDVVDLLNEQINDPDENFVTKALKRTMLNQFRDGLKKSLENNNSDRKAVEEFCTEFQKNLQQSLSESSNSK